MKHIDYRMPYKRGDHFDLYLIGDIHLGAAACDEKLLVKTIEEIKNNDRALVIIMGDVIDAIGMTGSDKRSDRKTLAKWLLDDEGVSDVFDLERDRAIDMLRPIAHKIVAWILGNHEDAVEKHRGNNIYWDMVSRTMEVAGRKSADVALGWEGFVNLLFRRDGGGGWKMIIYVHHGFGGGKKPGSHANNLFDLMGSYPADLHAIGHTHTMISVPREITLAGKGNTPSRTITRWGVVTGSFLKAHIPPTRDGKPRNTYAQAKGLSPLPTNFPVVTIYPADRVYDITFRNHR